MVVCWGTAPGASAELCPDQMMTNALLHHPGLHLGALEEVSGPSPPSSSAYNYTPQKHDHVICDKKHFCQFVVELVQPSQPSGVLPQEDVGT